MGSPDEQQEGRVMPLSQEEKFPMAGHQGFDYPFQADAAIKKAKAEAEQDWAGLPGLDEQIRVEESVKRADKLFREALHRAVLEGDPEPPGMRTYGRSPLKDLADEVKSDTAEEDPFTQLTSTPRDNLLAFHDSITAKARETMRRKNQDYASAEDPYTNFQLCEHLGLASTASGILIRLSDKLSRLATFEQAGEFAVEDEKLLDTVEDAINYLILYGFLRRQAG